MGSTYTINGAKVVCGDVTTANATVCIINSVLMPNPDLGQWMRAVSTGGAAPARRGAGESPGARFVINRSVSLQGHSRSLNGGLRLCRWRGGGCRG